MAERWHRDLWLDALWEDETLRPAERLVAYAFGRFAGRTEESWCSWDQLRRRTGIRSRTTIWHALTGKDGEGGLVGKGWLKLVDPPRQHRSAVYRLTVPFQVSEFRTSESASGSSDVARSPVSARQKSSFRRSDVRISDPIDQIENSEENSDSASNRTAPPSGRRGSKTTKSDHQAITEAATIVIDDGVCGADWPDAVHFARWIRRNRPHAKHLAAYVRALADDRALEPLWQQYLSTIDDDQET